MNFTQAQKLKNIALRIAPVAVLGLSLAAITSCNAQNGFKKTKDGLEYKIVKDAPGDQKAKLGDYMEFHIKTRIGDSLLFDSRTMNNNMPVPFQVPPAAFKGDLSEGLMMLNAGDSAIFRVSVDSIIKSGAQPLPWMEQGKNQRLTYEVSVVSVKNPQQMQADAQKAADAQVGVDEKLIQDWLTKNNIKATKTASGLYYVVDTRGTGALPAAGDSVSMNYTGRTLDGNAFDSNIDPQFQHVQPLWFVLGMRQVIPGWDEGIALMPKGSKGKLIIPSGLAYGPNSPTPAIAPNSVLVFDVEVVDVKKK